MKKALVVGLTALLVFGVVGVAAAAPFGGAAAGGPGVGGYGLQADFTPPILGFDELNLTDEQVAEIETLHETHLAAMTELRESLWAVMADLRTAYANGDTAAVTELRAQATEIREEMAAARDENRQAFLDVLTEEQIQKLEKLRATNCPGGYGRGNGVGGLRGGFGGPRGGMMGGFNGAFGPAAAQIQ